MRLVLPYVELACALAAAGLWYTQGGAVWYAGDWPGPWPLALLALAWISHFAWAGLSQHPTWRDILVALFLYSAWVGVWTAYDPGPAWAKFWLVVGAVGLLYAVAHQPDLSHLYGTLACFGVFGVVISAYFFMTNDWSANPPKVAALGALGQQISSRLPQFAAHRMHPNVVGGMLAMSLPLYVPLIVLGRGDAASHIPRPLRWGLPLLWTLAAGVVALTLAVTTSRGAWLGAVAVMGLWAAWRIVSGWATRRYGSSDRAWTARLVAVDVLLVVAVIALAVALPLVLSGQLPGTEALRNRLDMLRASSSLARDYLFSGAGLGTFDNQYSVYALLILVRYATFSHNMYLDLVVEQGLLGLLSYLGLVIAGSVYALRHLRRATRSTGWMTEAALASLAVILVHGHVDDVFYGSRALLLGFVPLGLIWAAGRTIALQRVDRRASRRGPWPNLGWVAVTVVILLALGGIVWRPVMGMWHANLGALAQSHVELAAYDPKHPDNPTLDEVRQVADLSTAEQSFTRAIESNAGNATARQRLAAIALSRGEYEGALTHTQAAWDAGNRDDVTRLLYGDALVAAGQVEQAARVVRGLQWAGSRLLTQAWYRYWVNGDYRRAADAWGTVVLLNPDNEHAAQMQAEALKKVGQ